MGTLNDIKQKAKGMYEEAKGDLNQKQDKGLKGGVQKLKGKARQKIAETKMKNRAKHAGAKGSDDWDRDDAW